MATKSKAVKAPKYLDVTDEIGLSNIQAGSRITYKKVKGLKYVEVVSIVVDEEEPTMKTYVYYMETTDKDSATQLLKYTGTQGMFVKDILNTHKLTIDRILLMESAYSNLKETSVTYNTTLSMSR